MQWTGTVENHNHNSNMDFIIMNGIAYFLRTHYNRSTYAFQNIPYSGKCLKNNRPWHRETTGQTTGADSQPQMNMNSCMPQRSEENATKSLMHDL